MGSAYHLGIEVLIKQGLDEAVEAVRNSYLGVSAFDLYDLSCECETVVRLLCGYQWRWEESGISHLEAERGFRLSLTNPATGKVSRLFDLAGKIDGVIQLEDARIAVRECKLLGEDIDPSADLWRRLRIDQQISLYVIAGRRLGYDVATVLYDVTRKPTIKPTAVPVLDELGAKIVLDKYGQRVKTERGLWRQTGDVNQGYVLQTRQPTVDEWGDKLTKDLGERPDHYYARVEIPRLDGDLREFEKELWDVQQTLRDAQTTGRHFRTVSKECVFCPYFEPCTTGYDPTRSLVPEGFEFVEDIHPELEGLCSEPTSTATA